MVVIEALLDKEPAFQDELKALIERHADNYEWYKNAGPIEEILQFISELHIEQKDLDKITELCFDGGNEIYHSIQPDWDGVDFLFDIQSVKGFEHLKNLESVVYISMLEEEVLEPMKEQGITIE
ncbi:MAG: ybaK/ebsC family protein [Gorillibacterium sp.]|nr:ybaK/ebsC family protein [Gorillibacterium sp.]